jgi:hypothetical protein
LPPLELKKKKKKKKNASVAARTVKTRDHESS